MNALINFINNLKYRSFFFYIIPISTSLIWTYKNQQFLQDDFYNGFSALLFQVIGIYFIGACWLIMYVFYKNSGNSSVNKNELDTKESSGYLTFINYQKAVFYAWVIALANIIFEFY